MVTGNRWYSPDNARPLFGINNDIIRRSITTCKCLGGKLPIYYYTQYIIILSIRLDLGRSASRRNRYFNAITCNSYITVLINTIICNLSRARDSRRRRRHHLANLLRLRNIINIITTIHRVHHTWPALFASPWPGHRYPPATSSTMPLAGRHRSRRVTLISPANLCARISKLYILPRVLCSRCHLCVCVCSCVYAYFFRIFFFTGLTFMIYDRRTRPHESHSCVGDGGGTHSSGDDVVSRSFL